MFVLAFSFVRFRNCRCGQCLLWGQTCVRLFLGLCSEESLYTRSRVPRVVALSLRALSELQWETGSLNWLARDGGCVDSLWQCEPYCTSKRATRARIGASAALQLAPRGAGAVYLALPYYTSLSRTLHLQAHMM